MEGRVEGQVEVTQQQNECCSQQWWDDKFQQQTHLNRGIVLCVSQIQETLGRDREKN